MGPALSVLASTGASVDSQLGLASLAVLGDKLTYELCSDVKVRMAVIAALLNSKADPGTLCYALPCVFNLSSEATMLNLLCTDNRIVGLLESCLESSDAKLARFSQGILRNMQLYRGLLQCRLGSTQTPLHLRKPSKHSMPSKMLPDIRAGGRQVNYRF